MWAQYKDNPVYEYEFNDQGAPWYYPKMPDTTPTGLMTPLAAHTIDIQFLFPDWHGGPLGFPHRLNAEERSLSGELVAAWTNFMYTGNPNRTGDSPWPRYSAATPTLLSQNVPSSTTMSAAAFATAHKCAFWDTVLVY